MNYIETPQPVQELLSIYRSNKKSYKTNKLTFLGVDQKDVYNISPAFELEGKTIIAGRVESRHSEISQVMFFEQVHQDTYQLMKEAMVIDLFQDPCITFINDVLYIGGTKIMLDQDKKSITGWNTSYYCGKNLSRLTHVFDAPYKMKDVRFIQYNHHIALFSRPQGHQAKKGKIGFKLFDHLEDINPQSIENATLLLNHFVDDDWGGANELHLLKNGLIGVLGHISTKDAFQNLHYYPMVFAFNPLTLQSTAIKIIAERSDFLPGPSKRPDLVDVLFTGGLVRHENQTATLYTGVSDVEAHYIVIDDPFLVYEED